ncbi:YdcF family protein [Falsiroseomonas sp.]|uniref:YdcF family protein n=1 Tax=Falsiroseomonas sp. TaxID=2870721 RepID=UPI003568B8A7
MQGALTGLLLPPLLLVMAVLAAGLLAWRGWRAMGGLAALCALLLLLLSTPFAAGSLAVAVARLAPAEASIQPAAIIVLGGEMVRGEAGAEVGPLTLERLRAGAALHRRTGLPLLVSGGPVGRDAPPVAELMAASLREDFGVPVRWVEPRARDTRDNAVLAAAMLRAEGIEAAHLVTHAWHMPRSLGAFARAGLPVEAAPVRQEVQPRGTASDWLPRPDHLARSWFMLREAAGLLVYRIRDGN